MRRNKYNARKVMFQGIEFDSKAEYEYYLILKNDKLVKHIELQPKYTIIDPYEVLCRKCDGRGRVLNEKTLNFNKCKACKGSGKKKKQGAIYTADFKVIYIDGEEKIIDIKGGPVSKDFTLRRKLFEIQTGKELTVIKKTKQGWVTK
ncbi:DUF1064 domain-containing protein [Oceanobacillus sp. FSL W7-1281]|uniref:DUF1064 domain-containing protein n=1 Tax=Oceanobacillus sp. FSL W7-1281 TaxID=2921698 RepID=UPI0030DB011C